MGRVNCLGFPSHIVTASCNNLLLEHCSQQWREGVESAVDSSPGRAVHGAYSKRFGLGQLSPPLELGIHSFPSDKFRKLAPEAICMGKLIDWSEHFPPLSERAES